MFFIVDQAIANLQISAIIKEASEGMQLHHCAISFILTKLPYCCYLCLYQGLIEPKRQEGMQLNVNRQTEKCKALLRQHGRQELTDILLKEPEALLCLKIVTVYISPFTCHLAASQLNKPLVQA